MTVQAETSKVVYLGDGETVNFPVPFCFFEKQIAVFLGEKSIPLEEGKDYTIDKNERLETGRVILAAAPVKDERITIVRDVAFNQLTTFLEGEDFPAVDFEKALDKLTMALQQLREKLSRTLTTPVGEDYDEEDLFRCFSMLTKNFHLMENIPLMIDELRIMYNDILNNYYSAAEVDAKLEPATPLRFVNTTLSVSAETAVQSTDCPGFPYKVNIALEGAVAAKVPNVCFNGTDAQSGRFASVASSYDGGISLYLNTNETYETVIPIILLQ